MFLNIYLDTTHCFV
ncbi:MAG TPA: hypothetical protein DCQ37_10030 [Desulfobacteraceae bacterium]|nr:hypothetical protein [Desulfobacteraceae bacterium]